MNASDLELAIKTLVSKEAGHTKYFDYYEGRFPLIYNAAKLRELFEGIDARFTENWCGVVIDSTLDRVALEGFNIAGNEKAAAQLNTLFASTELDLDADDVHLAALVTGESYIVAWRDDETGEVEAFYNDPRNCHVFYEADNPNVKRFAVKWWLDDEGHRRVNLYYREELQYYRSRNKVKNGDSTKALSYDEIEEPADNPFGRIPVFQFRKERRAVRSELASIIEPQDSLNKLVADMMVAAEFGAFRQRYAISQSDLRGKLKNSPNEIWTIPASDGEGQSTSVGEFSATDLGNYIAAIDQRANTIAVTSRTPKHFFFNQGGDPSGESLIVQESPLNKKCKRYVKRFAAIWRKVAAFLLELDGVNVDPLSIEPMFARVETVQPRTEAEIRQINVSAGIPLITQLKWEGWTEADIDAMLKDADKMAARQQAGIGAALLNAQEAFDRGEDPGDDGETDSEQDG